MQNKMSDIFHVNSIYNHSLGPELSMLSIMTLIMSIMFPLPHKGEARVLHAGEYTQVNC